MSSTRERGSRWERAAESHLRRSGLKTLEKNYRVRFGEIDLVMLDRETLVFVEVRYRASDSHGSGAESVTWRKQKRIVMAAQSWLKRHRRHAGRPCRFDVISIGRDRGRARLNWIRSAFDAGH